VRRAAILLALGAAPALAQSDELLECPSAQITPAFRDKIADAMLGPESAESDALFVHLAGVTQGCAARHGLAGDKGEAYFTYALGRLPHDALIGRLDKAGISAAVLDDALDFGPGRSNPVISGDLDPAQLGKLVAALAANGVNLDQVSAASWELVGVYAAATSLMWQAHAQLR